MRSGALAVVLGLVAALGELAAHASPGREASWRSAKRSSNSAEVLPAERFFEPERLVSARRGLKLVKAAASSGSNGSAPGKRGRRHIRVVAIEVPPFMMIRRGRANDTRASERQPLEWFGYCMDFFKELIKHLPYEVTYEIYQVADNKFGSKRRSPAAGPALRHKSSSGGSSNKSGLASGELQFAWNGLVGELERRRAHLALAPLAVMAERELVMDFTVPFYDLVGIQILLKRPEVAQNWFKFLTVLDNDVWLSITLAYFVTSLIIYLFDRLSPYSHKNQARIRRLRERRRLARRRAARGRSLGAELEPPRVPAGLGPPLPLGGLLGPDTPPGAPPLLLARGGRGSFLAPAARDSASRRRRRSQDYLSALRLRLGRVGVSEESEGPQASRRRAARHVLSPPDNSDEPDTSESCGSSSSESPSQQEGRPDFNLRDSLWFCITSLTPQGGGEAPQNLSGRVVAGAWWLFCFIVIASYTANLAAFLTVSRLDIPIESLDDLAKQYRIKYAPIDGTAEANYFERMAYIEEIFYNIWKEMSLNESLSEEERSKFSIWDYPISDKYTKIWAQIQETQMPSSLESAIERVRSSSLDDGFALLANANMIKYATMTDCSFRAVGEEFSRKPIALGLAKGLEEMRDDISYAILQLINRRFMEILREKWWTNNPARVTCDERGDESEGISVENIGGVFMIILAGVLLSFLVWALERLAYGTKLEVSRELLEGRQLSSGPAASSISVAKFKPKSSPPGRPSRIIK